jgi:hypothetical protein
MKIPIVACQPQTLVGTPGPGVRVHIGHLGEVTYLSE